jgi:hydroxyacylglutathione hydrolase
MIIELIKSEGLAHNSYFIGSGGIAAVIDPRRDIQVYLDLAQRHGLVIRYVFETHRNEDYVIGSLELAAPTGAAIYHGPWLDFMYGKTLNDGQEFNIGKIKIAAMHTPGHSDDSMSYTLTDLSTGHTPVMVFTGDALFVNDSGRVDFGGLANIPRMASNLYDSLFHRLLPLGDGVIICPGHGGGSLCGSRIADREISTLGLEKLFNPALQHTREEDFIRYKAAEVHEKPPYFSIMERYNLEGPPLLHTLPSPPPLSPSDFKLEMEKGSQIIDTSMPANFGGAHLKGAYNIWLAGLPAFAGWFLPYDKPLLLVFQDDSYLDTAVRYLIRLGYDNIAGYLKNGTEEWYDAGYQIEKLSLLTVQQLKALLDKGQAVTILDVRAEYEWSSGHIAGAQNVYVGKIAQRLADISNDKPLIVICSIGHRASIAASILLRAGFTQVSNVLGGMTAWRQSGYSMVK